MCSRGKSASSGRPTNPASPVPCPEGRAGSSLTHWQCTTRRGARGGQRFTDEFGRSQSRYSQSAEGKGLFPARRRTARQILAPTALCLDSARHLPSGLPTQPQRRPYHEAATLPALEHKFRLPAGALERTISDYNATLASGQARWGATAVIVIVSAGVRYAIFGSMDALPFVLFFPAVIDAAVLFDHGSGIFATASALHLRCTSSWETTRSPPLETP